jgi:cbb3-type cytochrome oxidase maturation protein
MEALFFLIPLALIFCALTIKAFFWAVSHRQFDNLDSAARSILFDEDEHVRTQELEKISARKGEE